MKKQFIVVAFDNAEDCYVVEDLLMLINEMYEVELMNGKSFDEVSEMFYSYHKVFEVNGEVKELN